jgi:capsular exopolysaccharide synthesis family protein
MTDSPRYVSFRDYLRVVRQRWLLIVALTILCGGVAYVLSAHARKSYQAEASLNYLSDNAVRGDVGLLIPETETPDQRAAIAADAITQHAVATAAAAHLGGNPPHTPADLLKHITANAEARTSLVVITASSSDPKFAAQIANAFAVAARDTDTANVRGSFADRANVLRQSLHGVPNNPSTAVARATTLDQIQRLEALSKFAQPVVIVHSAGIPKTAVSPRVRLDTAVGAILGLTLGFLIAFIRDALDRRFRTAGEIGTQLELPVIGHVAEKQLGRSPLERSRRAPRGGALEPFRIIRTSVEFFDASDPPVVTLVTSALAEEGKSTVAAGLAISQAAAGKRTLLLECDLRRPALASRLQLRPNPGLSNYLLGTASPSELVQVARLDSMWDSPSQNGSAPEKPSAELLFVSAGPAVAQSTELLASPRFEDMLRDVRTVYDAVVIDSSPLLPVADTLPLIAAADAVVLCVRTTRATTDQVAAAKAILRRFPSRPTGIVLTGVRRGSESDYGYYGHRYDAAKV